MHNATGNIGHLPTSPLSVWCWQWKAAGPWLQTRLPAAAAPPLCSPPTVSGRPRVLSSDRDQLGDPEPAPALRAATLISTRLRPQSEINSRRDRRPGCYALAAISALLSADPPATHQKILRSRKVPFKYFVLTFFLPAFL